MKILVVSFLTLLFVSCKTEEKVINNKSEVSQTNNIKVSFISIGSGIDKNGIKQLESLISQFESNNKVKLNIYIKSWGREGEKDYCIDCSAISSDKKKELRLTIEQMFIESKLTRIISDNSCD